MIFRRWDLRGKGRKGRERRKRNKRRKRRKRSDGCVVLHVQKGSVRVGDNN